ncbi:unnamed protein product [Gordionus sp. m RMFG-2023]
MTQRREGITTERGCLLWRTKMIIPQQYLNNVLDMIHQGHIGMLKMKMRALQYAWSPNINQDIQEQHNMPQKIAIQNWQNHQKHGTEYILIMLDHFKIMIDW